MESKHTFNLDNLDPATVPSAPLGAFDEADWHDVPEGFYLLPVHDWTKFSNECGVDDDDETPPLDFLGFRVIVRETPTLIKAGKRAGQSIGQDRFIVGRLVLARGVQERVIEHREKVDGPVTYTERLTPSDRLKREVEGDKWGAEHDLVRDGDASPSCQCDGCIADAHLGLTLRWKPAPPDAYANEVAAALIHSIKNENDALRRLYGQLTGHCGMCGRFIHDPESKRLGLGPDCRGRR